MIRPSFWNLLVLLLAASPRAQAAEPRQASAVTHEAAGASPTPGEHGHASGAAPAATHSPSEEPSKEPTLYLGLRGRVVWLPHFMMSIFGDGGETVVAPAIGPEVVLRGGSVQYAFSAQYTSYSMDTTLFRAKGDPDISYEFVDAQIHVLYLMADYLVQKSLSPKWDFLYGGGLGLGVVFGSLHRVQATHVNERDASSPWMACPANASGTGPLVHTNYCDLQNDHYGDYSEPSWFHHGSKPAVFPWLSLQTGAQFHASREVLLRLDAGWNLFNGPFVGLAADYGL